MDDAQKEAIAAHHEKLRSTFSVAIDAVIYTAYSNGIISDDDVHKCDAIDNVAKRASEIIKILVVKQNAWSWLLAFCEKQKWGWLRNDLIASDKDARKKGTTAARQREPQQSAANQDTDDPDHDDENSSAVNNRASLPTYTMPNQHTVHADTNAMETVLDRSRPTVFLLDIRSVRNASGTGFLAEISLKSNSPVETKQIYGLMTNNHVFSYEMLQDRRGVASIIIERDIKEVDVNFQENIKEHTYIFTCPLLDCTFIELTEKQRAELNKYKMNSYLRVEDNTTIKLSNEVLIVQHPQGGEKRIGAGKILGLWGVRIHHSAGTDEGSSGSPLFNTAGSVIGLHCGKVNDNYKSATAATYLLKAMAADYFNAEVKSDANSDCTMPKWPRALGKLDDHNLNDLKFLGVEIRDMDDTHTLFKVTSKPDEMWLYRAQYWWFWTLSYVGEKSAFPMWCWNPVSTEKCIENKILLKDKNDGDRNCATIFASWQVFCHDMVGRLRTAVLVKIAWTEVPAGL